MIAKEGCRVSGYTREIIQTRETLSSGSSKTLLNPQMIARLLVSHLRLRSDSCAQLGRERYITHLLTSLIFKLALILRQPGACFLLCYNSLAI